MTQVPAQLEQTGSGPRAAGRTIAITSGVIGLVAAVGSGTFGYANAKEAYDKAKGGTAGLSDYINVGNAFWDVAPIAIAVLILGLLVANGARGPALYPLAAFLLAGAGYAASTLDPPTHLEKFYRAVASNPHSTPDWIEAYTRVYGALAVFLAGVAGVGVAVAITQLTRNNRGATS
jgi:hypothetical protein